MVHYSKMLLFFVSLLLMKAAIADHPPASELHNQKYGPHQRHRLDVYWPQQHDSTTPVVVLLHGGAWIIGHKKQWQPEIIHALTQQGYAVCCINYRYACGDYRAQMQDMDRVLQYVRTQAAEGHMAPDRVALAGVSAGGHLSLLYGQAHDTAGVVKAIISLAGPTDLSDTLFHRYARNYCIGFVFQRFLGCTFRQQPALYAEASPVFCPGKVPSLFIHGRRDNLVPPSQSQRMYDALRARGTPADTVWFGHTGHLITGKKKANLPAIIAKMKYWLQRYL